MLYEAAIGLVLLTLLFLLLPALEMPVRRITACAKVEIILLGTRIRNWRRRVLTLPAKAAVPLCAAYILAAGYLAIHAPVPSPMQLAPWEEAAQSAAASRMKLLQEAALFFLTAVVYVGLASLFRRRRRAQESGAK